MRGFVGTGRAVSMRSAGFTLIELMLVVAIIGILAAIAVPLYADMQTSARIAKAQADARSLASAVSMYAAHMSALPSTLGELTTASINDLGLSAGPFLRTVPTPPAGGGWSSAYAYTVTTSGVFTITAAGDGVTVTVP